MILCNLKNILAEKRTNISKVSRDTGISRTTLTSLYHNCCQGIQFDTVNTLCQSLDIDLSQLFIYSKFDISVRSNMPYFDVEKLPQYEFGDCSIIIKSAERKIDYRISNLVYFHYDKNLISGLEIVFELFDEDDDPNGEYEKRIMHKALSELQVPLKSWLRDEMQDRVCSEYEELLIEGYWLTVDYPPEFK